jgi:hypothetical protein
MPQLITPFPLPVLLAAAAAAAAIERGTKALEAPVRGVDIADENVMPPGELE